MIDLALIPDGGLSWLDASGPVSNIVLSTRVRLARNLRGMPFPGWAKKNDRIKIMELIRPAVETLPQLTGAFGAALFAREAA